MTKYYNKYVKFSKINNTYVTKTFINYSLSLQNIKNNILLLNPPINKH